MDIKVKKDPVSKTEELSVADISIQDEDIDLEDLTSVDGKVPGENGTPPPIRALEENAPTPIDAGEDDGTIPPFPTANGGWTRLGTATAVIAGIALVVFLIVLGRSGGKDTETASASSSTEDVGGIEDVTMEPDDLGSKTGDDKTSVTSKDAPETDKTVGVYDAEKCAAPATDREWLACAAAAYADLRLEQKRLANRVVSLEERELPGLSTEGAPGWMKAVMAVQSGLIVLLFVLFVGMFRKRNGSGSSAS